MCVEHRPISVETMNETENEVLRTNNLKIIGSGNISDTIFVHLASGKTFHYFNFEHCHIKPELNFILHILLLFFET